MNTVHRFSTKQDCASDLLTVLIVEDQELVRIGLQRALKFMPNIRIAGMAFDGPSAVDKALELKPDLIIMDIGLPGFDGIEATRRIKSILDCRVLMFTSNCEAATIYDALESGADGYCLKGASIATLQNALKTVATDVIWLDEEVSHLVLNLSV